MWTGAAINNPDNAAALHGWHIEPWPSNFTATAILEVVK